MYQGSRYSFAFWRHAVVERLTKGTDECARAAVIRVSDEKGHVKLLQGSIQHLIPLEASTEDTSQDSTNELPPIMMIPKVCPRVLQGTVEGEIIRRSHHKDNIAH